jgi:hypothetical protein
MVFLSMGEFSFLIRAGEGLDTLMGVMWLDKKGGGGRGVM